MFIRGQGRERQRERQRRRDERLERAGYPTPPSSRNGRRLHDIRCFKCGAKIGEAERTGPEDVIILPPDQVEYQGPLPHPWTIVLWCRYCRERRAVIQHPSGPPRSEENPLT